MDWRDMAARDHVLAGAHAALVADGVIVPLELGADDERFWADCDLASYAENRLGELCDPRRLQGRTRDRWLATALDTEEPLVPPRQRESEACYWILHDGRRAGTVAISRFCLGDFVTVHSVYLRPQHRGRRIMAKTLDAVHAELEARGLGMRLDSSWTWQRAVRFYFGTGFWLRSWKRELAFVRPPRAPSPVVTVGDAEAAVAVEVQGHRTVLARARRDGRRLLEHSEVPELPQDVRYLVHNARTTLALAIALEGWPLIRSNSYWDRCRASDLVHPEALASRIRFWEAWAARHGWRVATPRIPDLDYASWADLEADWA